MRANSRDCDEPAKTVRRTYLTVSYSVVATGRGRESEEKRPGARLNMVIVPLVCFAGQFFASIPCLDQRRSVDRRRHPW